MIACPNCLGTTLASVSDRKEVRKGAEEKWKCMYCGLVFPTYKAKVITDD